VMYKNHLLKGVKKGALTPEQAEAKFQTWMQEKTAKIDSKKKEQELSLKDARKKDLETETKVKDAKAEALARKIAKAQEALHKESEEATAAAETTVETSTESVPETEPKQE